MPGPTAEEFTWAVGIEDTFVPQVLTRTGRTLDEYELTQHYRLWRHDLGLAASLGVRAMRYGIPWYRVNPAPSRFDWSWTDEVLEHMVREVRIDPIVDLMHYGCPLWLEREFLNPDYPRRVAEYAAAFVDRYRTLVRSYTPLNEPTVNAIFCGRNAIWPPYLRGDRGFVRVLLALVQGMTLTIDAIRGGDPRATIVHVEAASHTKTDDPALEPDARMRLESRFLPTDLLLGRVDDRYPLYGWLLESGADEAALAWLRENPRPIDVMGLNFYPNQNCWVFFRKNGRVLHKRYYGSGADLGSLLASYRARFGVPVMVTETSSNGAVRRRERWLDESVAAVREARAAGVPVVGYTWWPLFSFVDWPFRRGNRVLGAYLRHWGLWDLRDDGNGTLERVPTRLVERYADYVRQTM